MIVAMIFLINFLPLFNVNLCLLFGGGFRGLVNGPVHARDIYVDFKCVIFAKKSALV